MNFTTSMKESGKILDSMQGVISQCAQYCLLALALESFYSFTVLQGFFPSGGFNQYSQFGLSEQLLLVCVNTSLHSESCVPPSAEEVFSCEEDGLFQSLS